MGSYNEPNPDNWWENPASEPESSVTVTSAPANTEGGGGGQDINQIYEQYLGRGVDASGASTYAGWSNQDIINAIQSSPEYANYTAGGGGGGNLPGNTGGGGTNANALYQQYLGRDIDPSGAATWAGKSMDEIIAGITGSQEYAGRGGSGGGGAPTTLDYGSMTPEQTVSDIYRKVLGREADAGAKGWIEDIRGGTSALELAQRLQASDEGKAYLAANPELAYKAMVGLSQQNAPFKREGDQFGYTSTTRDPETGNIINQQFNPTIDFSGLKYTGSPTRTVGGGESSTGQTVTTHQYEDGKGGTITVDDRGNMISYTPSIQWYAEQNAKHPDAVRQGYRNLSYMATGPIDKTIKIMGQDVPIEAQEYMTNDKGQLVVDKSGNLIPMIREPSSPGGWESAMSKIVDTGIMAVGALGGGPLGAAAASGLVGLKNETPTNQILKNAALAAGTTWAAGQFLPDGSLPLDEITGSTFTSPAFQLTTEGANAANLALQNAPAFVAPAINAASTVANTATNTAPSAVAPAVAPSSIPPWLEAAQRGAIVGGAMGGVNSVLSGQNPLMGIATGIATGAVGGASNSALNGGFLGNVGSGALAGMTGAALNKQNIGTGALYGGGGGALNYAANSPYAPDWAKNPMIRNAITGGALSVARGDDFTKGMASGVVGGFIGNQANNYINTLFPNTNVQSPTNAPILKSEETNIPSSQEVMVANQPTEPDLEAQRGTQPNAPLARLASYTSQNELPLPEVESIYPTETEPYTPQEPNPITGRSENPDGSINYTVNDRQVTLNTDSTVTITDPDGNQTVLYGDQAANVVAIAEANEKRVLSEFFQTVRTGFDEIGAQNDMYMNDGGGYGGARAIQIPSTIDQFRALEEQGIQPPYFSAENNDLSLRQGQSPYANEPFMTKVVDPKGSVTVTGVPELNQPAKVSPLTPQQEDAMIGAQDAQAAIQAAEMSQPSDPQEALMISESAAVEANATPQEQEIISQLKDIITSPDTSPEQKQVAAEELKQLSVAIATQGGEAGSNKGVLDGTTDGSKGGVEGGVKGGVEGGILGGIIGARGLQPGTGGGYQGEDPNLGLDKQDMEEEPEPEPEEPFVDPNDILPELPSEEPPEEKEPSTKKPNLPRQPLPIKKPVYPSQIPGYSFNQNISGALPGNLTATMLAGAPTQEGRRMLQQLKQLYPQLSTIDPHLLQTLSSRAGAGSGGGALSTPAPGYPDQASGKTSFAQSSMPANFNALNASGLQALGGASNPNIAGYADGGDVHIPEFKTGTTGHYVQGRGDGQSDEIPAMLANGEYVFDADTVAALGNGSNEAGARALDKMREAIRKHKRSAPHTKIPPKAKSPLEYLKGK
jgi:hypothetical protein